jgi:hypothetical protein
MSSLMQSRARSRMSSPPTRKTGDVPPTDSSVIEPVRGDALGQPCHPPQTVEHAVAIPLLDVHRGTRRALAAGRCGQRVDALHNYA